MKEIYDLRGRQRNIFRLAGFDYGALIHMVAYRILIFISLIVGVVILGSLLLYPQDLNMHLLDGLVILIWILITPQLYGSVKAFALIASGGLSSPNLNRSFVNATVSKSRLNCFYKALPCAVLAVWAVGFVIISVMWLR